MKKGILFTLCAIITSCLLTKQSQAQDFDLDFYQYFEANEGKKYDAIGVVGMVYKTALLDNPEHKFCSEVCYEALTQAQFPLPKVDARLISPLQLRRLIRGLGYKPLVYQNS